MLARRGTKGRSHRLKAHLRLYQNVSLPLPLGALLCLSEQERMELPTYLKPAPGP